MPKMQRKSEYQLKDSPFYRLRSRKRLAEHLRVSKETLDEISKSSELYVRRWKHKKHDHWLKQPPDQEQVENYRPIDIPDQRLKSMQGRISEFLSRVAAPDFLFSPVKGRSYVENAARHRDAKAFWLLDVADYFPSCSANNVARFFSKELQCSPDVTAVLVHLTTLNGCLPQGSPCSPILAYYSNSHIWLVVDRLVTRAGCTLSLYADDITISGEVVPKSLVWEVKKLIFSNGLRLKKSKEVSLINSPADITGVIVKNGATYLPNRQFKRLAEIKRERASATSPKVRARLDNQISGRLAQRRQVENPKD